MARKKKKAPEGAPDWMVTYGDMMTLLFCFFVIIVSMSEIKEEEKFQKVIESIKRAFGYRGGVGYVPQDVTPNNTFNKEMTQLVMHKWQLRKGKTSEEGIEGENPSVKYIREGIEFTLGGQVSFKPGQAYLLDTAKQQLKGILETFRGLNTKIRIRGHATRKNPEDYRPYKSLDELSFARAMAVKEYLISLDVREERISVEACGDNEPLVKHAYSEAERARNRRVSIIVTENLVEQFQGESEKEEESDSL